MLMAALIQALPAPSRRVARARVLAARRARGRAAQVLVVQAQVAQALVAQVRAVRAVPAAGRWTVVRRIRARPHPVPAAAACPTPIRIQMGSLTASTLHRTAGCAVSCSTMVRSADR
jgi:hypothetical protein